MGEQPHHTQRACSKTSKPPLTYESILLDKLIHTLSVSTHMTVSTENFYTPEMQRIEKLRS